MASEQNVARPPATAIRTPAHLWVAVASTAAATVCSGALTLGANPVAIGATVLVAALCLLALFGGWLPTLALTITAITTVGFWDYFEANDLRPIAGALTLTMVAAVVLSTRRGHITWRLSDLGAAFVVLAASVPAIVSREVEPLFGIVTSIGGTYLLARVVRVRRQTVLTVVLWIGAGHGVAAILAAGLGITRLLPIADPQGVLVTTRGIGLYLNPNTLGNVEAIVLVMALWWGIPRRHVPLVILVLAGLVLSGSREAMLGAVIATLAVGAIHPRRVTPLVLGGAVAFLVSFVLLPEIAVRFDPGTFASDRSLSDRLLSWDQALHAIGLSPVLGYGLERNAVIDQAFLEWLVRGGIVGFGIWLVGLSLLTIGSRAWPVVLAMAAGGLLANTFAGPPLMLLLFIAGTSAGGPRPTIDITWPMRRVGLCGLVRPSLAPLAKQRWRTPDRPQR